VEHGANYNKEDNYGFIPFYIACRFEKKLSWNIINEETRKNDSITIKYACEGGNEAIVVYLLELRADINKENKKGNTSIFYFLKNEIIIKFLTWSRLSKK